MHYKLWKTHIRIIGPGEITSAFWAEMEVNVTFSFGETADFCQREERFRLSASRFRHATGDFGDPSLGEPQWSHYGSGVCQRDLEEALRYLKAFNRYVEKLPVHVTTLPDLLNALLVHYKAKTVNYAYYPFPQHAGSTEHQNDAYPSCAVYVVRKYWEELLAFPSKPIEEAVWTRIPCQNSLPE